jgi:hypothetical protein
VGILIGFPIRLWIRFLSLCGPVASNLQINTLWLHLIMLIFPSFEEIKAVIDVDRRAINSMKTGVQGKSPLPPDSPILEPTDWRDA